MLIEMKVAGITIDPFNNTPIVILKDSEGNNALPIWIGILEASAIASELGAIKPPRPMTHDLMKNIIDNLEVMVAKIEVIDLRENTFFATISLSLINKTLTIDARPSDAIALALRTNAPIFVDQKVLDKSRTVNLEKAEKARQEGSEESQKWAELLENLSAEDFGKYKM